MISTLIFSAALSKKPAPTATTLTAPENGARSVDWNTIGASLVDNPLLLATLVATFGVLTVWIIRRLRHWNGLRNLALWCAWLGGAWLALIAVALPIYVLNEPGTELTVTDNLVLASIFLAPLILFVLWRMLPGAIVALLEQTKAAGFYYRRALTRRKALQGTTRYLLSPQSTYSHSEGSQVEANVYDPMTLAVVKTRRFIIRGRKPSWLNGMWLVVDATQTRYAGGTCSMIVERRGVRRRLDHQTVLSGWRSMQSKQPT